MRVVATAGHVDHGKSALVRALTGREPDRLAEERRRGLTIDLGYVWTDLAVDGRSVTVAFVDVPGHDRFLTNMLAGVGAVEDVLFVVAADDGWSAQSEEHLEIVTLLGRRIVAAAVTKAAPAGAARTADVVAEVRDRLADVGLTGTPVLAVDALEPSGLEELRAALVAALAPDGAGTASGQDAVLSFPRLWVDRVFTAAGAGTVVTGTLTSGRLQRGGQVAVLPGGVRGRIRELRSLEVSVEAATAPARVAVALAGVDSDQVDRGDALVGLRRDGAADGVATQALDVSLAALPHGVVGNRGAWQLHLGSARREARVLPLLGELQPGEHGLARIEVEVPLPARIGDRFVLREVGRRRTAAGGTVLEVAPPHTRRGVTARLVHAEALEEIRNAHSTPDRVAAVVALRGGAARLTALEAAVGAPLAATLDEGGPVAQLETMLVARERLAEWVTAAATAARAAPTVPAVDAPLVSRDQLAGAITDRGCPTTLVPAVLRAALENGEVVDVGGRVLHRDHHDTYLAGRSARQERLLAALDGRADAPGSAHGDERADQPGDGRGDAAGLVLLDSVEVEEVHGVPRFELQPLLDAGTIVQRDGVLFTPATVTSALERLEAGPGAGNAPFTASDARQAWGLTRKHAVPLLEQLRAAGLTTFDGTHHRRSTRHG